MVGEHIENGTGKDYGEGKSLFPEIWSSLWLSTGKLPSHTRLVEQKASNWGYWVVRHSQTRHRGYVRLQICNSLFKLGTNRDTRLFIGRNGDVWDEECATHHRS